jgi:type IV secretion system protein TrbG
MDTRRTMIAPKAACMAGCLALLLTTAIPALMVPTDVQAQVQRKPAASKAKALRPTTPVRRAAPTVRRPAVKTVANEGKQARADNGPSVGLAAIRAANAEALAPSRADGFLNAAQVFSFEQGRVYEVWTAPMRITAVTLEPGERIINKAAGDTERWMIGDTTSGEGQAQQSQILIKPYRAGLSTNMVIATSRRMYLLSLKAGESADAFNAIVNWTYPSPLPNGLTNGLTLAGSNPVGGTTTKAAIPGQTANIQSLNQSYRIRAGWRKPAWTPVSVSDDGRQTFITFPDSLGSTEAPPLFVIGETGEAQLTNWRKQGAVYVVDRLIDRAELRLGGDNARVVRIERKGVRS